MNQVKFGASTLGQIDAGRVAAHLDQAIKLINQDLLDRPTDDKPRTVNLLMRFTPVAQGGELEDVNVEFEIKTGTPPIRSKLINMNVGSDGLLNFHPDLPEDGDGSTLYDDATLKIKTPASAM